MRKCLFLSAVLAGVLLSAGPARASGWPPYYTSAVFPCHNQGWQTDLWWYHWHYPWYAHYNFSHGPYANWTAGGGWATYGGNCAGGGCGYAGGAYHSGYSGYLTAGPAAEATVTIALPSDAKLLFNGVAATGTGASRSFRTPPLQKGQSYTYELTAEVVRDGKTLTTTEKVVVRGGETASVTLDVGAVRAASK
jgi:uncharacterized protein (TIGR03000 family)